MNKYEAMIIVKPDLTEEERKNLLNQITDAITKNKGTVSQAAVWSERRKLFFPIKKNLEGIYYLVNFSISGPSISDLRHAYNLNENILRVLFSRLE